MIPRFKVGDWVTDGISKCQIYSIDDTYYWYSKNCILGSIESIDRRYCLWTIEDAKDGNILAEDSCIFIIKKLNHYDNAEIYCCLFDDGDFELNASLIFDNTSTYPATKEQSNLLFQKMHEAGYEWDYINKELRFIDPNRSNQESGQKQKPTLSKKDKSIIDRLLSLCKEAQDGFPQLSAEFSDIEELKDWLKSIEYRIK